MKNHVLHLPAPKISKRLKILLLLETLFLLISYFFIIYSYQQSERNKTENLIRQMGFSLQTSVQYSVNSLDTLSKSLFSSESHPVSPSLWSYISSPGNIEKNPLEFNSLFIDKYYQLNLLFPELDAFFLYSPTGEILSYQYNSLLFLPLDTLSDDFTESILDNNGTMCFFTQEELLKLGYRTNHNTLFAGRLLHVTAGVEPAAIVLVGCDISNIYSSFERGMLFDSQSFACFDLHGKQLFSSADFPGLPYSELTGTREYSDSTHYYQITEDDDHGVYTVIATEKSDFSAGTALMTYILFLIVPAVLLSGLLLSIYITRSVITSYGRMADRIYQQTIAEKDLTLQMLRAQINPHFLYNTLDSMRMASAKSGYSHLAVMCELLAKILRYGVTDSNHLVTVKEELDHLDEYIQLIKLRYPSINIYTCIDPSVKDYPMIKLLLQPLVENSITHGIQTDTSDGAIQIWGYQKDEQLIFTVSDNGSGMPEDQLLLLRDYLDDKNTAFKSIGLKNIKKRVQLYYGDKADFSIDSILYQGTTVTVTLPVTEGSPGRSERSSYEE